MPDAAVCANDQMAIGVLRALTAAGVRVPGVVAVTGFDDLYPGRLADPPLSTVSQPMRMLGQRACARLLDRIANPGLSPAAQMLPTSSCCGKAAAACPARSPASPSQPSSPVELTSKRHHPPVPAPVASPGIPAYGSAERPATTPQDAPNRSICATATSEFHGLSRHSYSAI
jgi:hypothetical protein